MASTELAGEALLAGRYAYVRELGRGASGRVILASDRSRQGARRALKVVGSEDAARLGWELEALARIAHPHVAAVHELLRVDEPVGGAFRLERGAAVLVEEHVEGAPAHQVVEGLRADPARWIGWVVRVGEATSRGLAAIHAAGLVHGDVKPANVVVGDDPSRTRLVDLGLARPPGLTRAVAGTPAYLAPEGWQGERTLATDLYALGATLHELLGGRSPLGETRSRSVAELVARAFAEPRTVDHLPADVPPVLRRLVGALLDADPARRPSSAREVAARLAAIASDLGLSEAAASGGGIEDAPTAVEQAMALGTLRLVGRDGELASLLDALRLGGVVAIQGPPGAGRTRLVREGVRHLQQARAAAGEPVPTHHRVERSLPAALPGHHAVLHVERADEVVVAQALAAVRAADVEGSALTVVLEREAPAPGVDALVQLSPIDRRSTAALLSAALGRAPSERLLDAAMRASGGLPGRLCRLMAEGVALEHDPSRPETLEELGAATTGPIGPIPPVARVLAEALAVAGGVLDPASVAGVPEARVEEAFAALVAGGLAALDEDGRLRLRGDVARSVRGGLSAQRRAALAQGLLPAALPPVEAAYLTAAAGDRALALERFLSAGSVLRSRGDPEGAARLAAEAAELLGPAPSLTLARADALRASGRYDEAARALAGADDPPALLLRAEVHRLRGEGEEAIVSAERAIDRATTDDLDTGALGHALLARLALDGGDLEGAERLARAATAAARSERSRSRAAETEGLVMLYRADLDGAAACAQEAARAARAAQDPAAEARAVSVEATVARARSEVRRAARLYARAFEIADRAGEGHAAAAFLVNLGLTRLDGGEPGPAIAALRDGARRLARLGRDQDVARALYNLGLAAVLVGDDDLARSAIRHARQAAGRARDREAEAYAAVLQAEMALRAGALDEARRLCAEGWESARSGPARLRAVVASRRAAILSAVGELDAARASIDEARAASDEDGSPAVASEQRVAGARVALFEGDASRAVTLAAEARAAAERAGTYEVRLRSLLVSADAAEAMGDARAAGAHRRQARALLDAAASTLSSSARARLRDVPAYHKALGSLPEPTGADPGEDGDGGRWRRLAFHARRLTAERRVRRLYEEIVDAAVELSGAERGFLILRDPEGRLRTRASRGLAAAEGAAEADGFSRSIAARAIDGAQPVTTVDALRDERLDGAASVHALSLRSVMAVPLRLRGDVAGAVYVDDRLRPGAFGPTDVALLADLADLASIALDGADLLRVERRHARRLSVLRAKLARTVESQALEIASLRRTSGDVGERFPHIVAHSAGMRRALDLVERVAPSEVPVLVTGESGTGKELVARAIHDASARRDAPFVGENCGAIPESLLESALFGHVRGAFTGAARDRVGLFEAAHGGTLFLDEIGEMSPAMQSKLLRAVQDGEIRPVGSERTRRVDVRIVAATHRDLEEMVRSGAFREDLYYRLAVVGVPIPPLRARAEDVAPLVAHLVQKHAPGREIRFDRRALACLAAYGWPGNVRQLENEVRRALVLGASVIREEDLSPPVRGGEEGPVDELDLKGQVQALERRLIGRALEAAGGNQTQAAKRLGVSRYGLQKMLKRLEIE